MASKHDLLVSLFTPSSQLLSFLLDNLKFIIIVFVIFSLLFVESDKHHLLSQVSEDEEMTKKDEGR